MKREQTNQERAGKEARRFYVSGRVQGVGFRWFVERTAKELGLAGYVKNLPEGGVEVYAMGSPQELTELNGRLWIGPASAVVRAVEQEQAPMLEYGSFRIEYA